MSPSGLYWDSKVVSLLSPSSFYFTLLLRKSFLKVKPKRKKKAERERKNSFSLRKPKQSKSALWLSVLEWMPLVEHTMQNFSIAFLLSLFSFSLPPSLPPSLAWIPAHSHVIFFSLLFFHQFLSSFSLWFLFSSVLFFFSFSLILELSFQGRIVCSRNICVSCENIKKKRERKRK